DVAHPLAPAAPPQHRRAAGLAALLAVALVARRAAAAPPLDERAEDAGAEQTAGDGAVEAAVVGGVARDLAPRPAADRLPPGQRQAPPVEVMLTLLGHRGLPLLAFATSI